MSSISFNGLATGLDTSALVEALMEIERQPIARLEADKNYFSSKLSVLKEFDSKLTSFLSNVEDLDISSELQPKNAALSSDDYFSVSATSNATAGNYQLKAYTLAQVEKLYSEGFADTDTTNFKTGTLSLTVDGTVTDITIDDENNTLTGIAGAINSANAGVTATIINDGTASTPYRLILTSDEVPDTIPDYGASETSISMDTSGLDSIDGTPFNPTFTVSQQAQQGRITVDNIDIYSNSNTYTNAIPGVTITLTDADAGAATTTLTVSLDEAALKGKISTFVSGYNDVMSFITSQSTQGDSTAGILNADSGLNIIKRQLQSLLTTRIWGSGSLRSLSELGLETQNDGTLKIDDSTLTNAIQNDMDSVVKLMVGEGSVSTGVKGIAMRFQEFLDDLTDTSSGFLAGRKKSTNSTLKRIDRDIERIELRLGKKEETLLRQFTALEELISAMNSQSDYLSQQMEMMNNLWSKK